MKPEIEIWSEMPSIQKLCLNIYMALNAQKKWDILSLDIVHPCFGHCTSPVVEHLDKEINNTS
jgi:hypothetical protein